MNGSYDNAYSAILDRLPVSIWIEDWSPVKLMVDALAHGGPVAWRRYFEHHPQLIIRAADTIDVIDVNAATLDLYRAKSKADVIDSTLGENMGSGELKAFREQLIAFAGGDMRFTIDAEELTMDDVEIHTRIHAGIVPEYRDDRSIVYCMIEERSKREQTDAAIPAYHGSKGELVYWETIKDSRNSEDYEAYLEAYPKGLFAPLARRWIMLNGGASEPPPVAHNSGLDFDRLNESAKKNSERARSKAAKR